MMLMLLLLFGYSVPLAVSRTSDYMNHCPSHNPQKNFDVKLLMGRWYVVEIVEHRQFDGNNHYHELNLESCPIVHLVQDNYSTIRLIWNEDSFTLYYHIKKADPTAPGFWVASGPHKEELIERHGQPVAYKGTIEVMKAVSSHAVLTFCNTDGRLFSVILSRDDWLPLVDTSGVNRMLDLRGLHPIIVKRTCSGNGAANQILTASLLLLLTFVLIL